MMNETKGYIMRASALDTEQACVRMREGGRKGVRDSGRTFPRALARQSARETQKDTDRGNEGET